MSKYNTCSAAQSTCTFLMTQPTHPHIVPYWSTVRCMDIYIVLHLYVYIITIITQERIQVLEWQKSRKTIQHTHRVKCNFQPPNVQRYLAPFHQQLREDVPQSRVCCTRCTLPSINTPGICTASYLPPSRSCPDQKSESLSSVYGHDTLVGNTSQITHNKSDVSATYGCLHQWIMALQAKIYKYG